MTALLICSAALLAAGTLATGLEAMTGRASPVFMAAGRLFWTAAGSLAAAAVALTGFSMFVRQVPVAAVERPALHLIGGLGIVVAASVLLHLFDGLPGAPRQSSDHRGDPNLTDNRFQ